MVMKDTCKYYLMIMFSYSFTRSIQTQQVASQLNRVILGEGLTPKRSNLRIESGYL